MTWLFVAAGLLLGLPLAALLFQTLAEALDRRRFPPPGRLVDVGGRRLHIHEMGQGDGPTVVIEAGRMNHSLWWAMVQREVAAFARVVTYDRAGYGWSDPDPAPRTGPRVVADLHTLLHRAGVPGPYLLVGHSLGAMYVRLFAQTYPGEVAGLLLVDPYTEGEVQGQPPQLARLQTTSSQLALRLARFGIVRLLAPLNQGPLRHLPGLIRRQVLAFTSHVRLWRAVVAEWRHLPDLVSRLETGPVFQGLPLTILSAGRCDLVPDRVLNAAKCQALWALQKRSQAALTALSDRARLVTIPDCGHSVQLEKPGAVVAAIRELFHAPN